MTKNVIIALFIIILAFVSFKNQEDGNFVKISHENTIIYAKIARTHEERVRGLSGKDILNENEGLLFIFDKEDYFGIWMKDMNFPIDIAWLDKNKRIIYIKENARPDSFPETFNPRDNEFGVPALYVLETNANFFSNNNIKVGDFLNF